MSEKGARKSAISTGRGDDGTTGLLFGGDRVSKDDLRTEAAGTIDEAVATLGLARAGLDSDANKGAVPRVIDGLPEIILRLQRELFVAGAELAAAPGSAGRQKPGETRVSAAMVEGLDDLLARMESHVPLPREFVVPGETRLSAVLEMARTVVRRAERRAVAVRRAQPVADDQLIPYLNRMADLLWVLARAAEQAEARPATPSRGRATRPGAAHETEPQA